MNIEIEEFEFIKESTNCNDTAAAMLVLAKAIRDSSTFSKANAQNFGHEIAVSLKDVLYSCNFSVINR